MKRGFRPAGVAGKLWRRGRFDFDVQGRVQSGSIAAPEGRRNGVVLNIPAGHNWY